MHDTSAPGDAPGDAPQGMRRVCVLVSGSVQGVFFRVSTREEARSLGLTGWVRNLPDGRVEAAFQGPSGAVDRAVAFCRRGPAAAVVAGVDARDVPVVLDEEGFAVR